MKQINEKIGLLSLQQNAESRLFKPLFYRLTKVSDQEAFDKLLHRSSLHLNDNLLGQLKELMKIQHPAQKLQDHELEALALAHIAPLPLEQYGVWVFYPWSNRLVHVLDEEEFIEVRTSRNKYKITPEEQDLLRQKKIGVIGLSVGQSVSLTLAMERIGGELRLADFDSLELTNLNRIRTGVHNLGLPKVYAVAREIVEIDPYLTVRCFPEGLTEENMDIFFTDGGKLDLLVEESDGFDIKILSRYKAKALEIPVIMEASDRCMVDVERFDLEPERSILHGLVDHLDLNTLKSLKTTEEKIPYMLDILGLETSSTRLKASMLEIDQTINTWPQLASAVTMGGGITADVSRRILLNSFTESGRYHVDIEELIGNKKKITTKEQIKHPHSINYKEHFKKVANQINLYDKNTLHLNDNILEQLVTAAALAPSGGNTQPWYWYYKSNTLMLFSSLDDHNTILGYNHYPTYIALGAATENVKIKAIELNLETTIALFPFNDDIPELIAYFTFQNKNAPHKKEDIQLAQYIPLRLTNRNISAREELSSESLNEIKNSIKGIEGAQLHFITNDTQLNNAGKVLGEIEKIRLLEKLGHQNFVEEIRWTETTTLKSKDGIDIRTIDLTNPELAGLKVFKDSKVVDLLRKWDLGDTLIKLTKKSVDSASAIGIISMPLGNKKLIYFNGGRAIQRAWLSSCAQGVAFQPLASSLFIYTRVLEGQGEMLSTEACQKLLNIKPVFDQNLHLDNNQTTVFIFRLNKANTPKIKSLRKPLDQIYCNLENE